MVVCVAAGEPRPHSHYQTLTKFSFLQYKCSFLFYISKKINLQSKMNFYNFNYDKMRDDIFELIISFF